MSNHRMNIFKTMMLLLGHERAFDLQADEPAARALRRRSLERTYDITPGRDDRLPDKWHGIVLGNEAGTTKAWKDTTAKAGEMAESLHACTMPHGSKGRVALANGKLMGKAYATMRLTAPANQQAVDSCLHDLQRHTQTAWSLGGGGSPQMPPRNPATLSGSDTCTCRNTCKQPGCSHSLQPWAGTWRGVLSSTTTPGTPARHTRP